jgi:hypothetical protein
VPNGTSQFQCFWTWLAPHGEYLCFGYKTQRCSTRIRSYVERVALTDIYADGIADGGVARRQRAPDLLHLGARPEILAWNPSPLGPPVGCRASTWLGGMAANIDLWEREFNAMGVSTFALDEFTGGGLMQVSTDQTLLGRLNFILDIYRSVNVLAKHPRVDPERIVLMGFSRRWPTRAVTIDADRRFLPNCNGAG